MDNTTKYPESLSEVMADAANKEPSMMDTVYGLPFPFGDEGCYKEDDAVRFYGSNEETMNCVYASPKPGILGFIKNLFGK